MQNVLDSGIKCSKLDPTIKKRRGKRNCNLKIENVGNIKQIRQILIFYVEDFLSELRSCISLVGKMLECTMKDLITIYKG